MGLWLRNWGEAEWYQPEWAWHLFDTDMLERKPLTELRNVRLDPAHDVVLHVCRSDPWVAPWLDDGFVRFVREAERLAQCEARLVTGQFELGRNPMIPRWNDTDYREAELMAQSLGEARRLAAGVIDSDEFAKCMEELAVDK
jgi:hypothetical protein